VHFEPEAANASMPAVETLNVIPVYARNNNLEKRRDFASFTHFATSSSRSLPARITIHLHRNSKSIQQLTIVSTDMRSA
jgi:hypothetical protein